MASARHWLDLTLRQKGLVLVFVPCLLELVFVLVLLNAVQAADDATQKTIISQRILDGGRNLINQIFLCEGGVGGYVVTGNDLYLKGRYFQNKDDFWKTLDSLKLAEHSSPSQLDRVVKIETEARQVFDQFEKEVSLMQSGQIDEARRALGTAGVLERIKSINTKLSELIEEEDKAILYRQLLERDSRNRLSALVAFGVTVNVGLSIFLSLMFNSAIVRRLRILKENSIRLAAGQVLHDRLGHGDEIAELDGTFHDMANSLIEAEHKLNAASEQLRSIVNNIPVGVFTLNCQGVILALNPTAQVMLGSPTEDLIGRGLGTLLQLDKNRDLLELATTSKRLRNYECLLIYKENKPLPVELSIEPVSIGGNAGFLAMLEDISERKKVEELKRDYINMVSHDLRSPLTGIRLGLSSILEGVKGPLPEEVAKSLTGLTRTSDRLIGLVNELLELEKLESGKLTIKFCAVPLSEVVDSALEAVSSIAEQKHVSISFAKPQDCVVYGDRERLTQVLINLLSNALKYSPVDGNVVIDLLKLDQYVELHITDQGPGIPAQFLPKLFNKFQRVELPEHLTPPGTGLGLAICKAIVEEHQGEIGVFNNEVGSTFWFRVPLLKEAIVQSSTC